MKKVFLAVKMMVLVGSVLGLISCGEKPATITAAQPVPVDTIPKCDCADTTVISTPQVWEGTGTVFTVKKKSCSVIATNMVWKSGIIVEVGDSSKVIVGDSIFGNGKLTIEPGVTVKCGDQAYLWVGYGSLKANGTAEKPILFTSLVAGAQWKGVQIVTANPDTTVMNYCTVENSVVNGILCLDTNAVITNCIVRNSALDGIRFALTGSPRDSSAFDGNVIKDNKGFAVTIGINKLERLSSLTSYIGNTKGGVSVHYAAFAEAASVNATWHAIDAEYVFSAGRCNVESPSGVTISVDPGTQLKFSSGSYLSIGYNDPATFRAVGTAAKPITFSSYSADSLWGKVDTFRIDLNGGIHIGSKSTSAVFSNCIIEKAVNGFIIEDSSTELSQSVIRNIKYHGIVFHGGYPSDSTNLTGVSLIDNGSYAIKIGANDIGRLNRSLLPVNSGKEGIYIDNSLRNEIVDDALWKKMATPYVFGIGSCQAGGNDTPVIRIEPGVTCKFDAGSAIKIGYVSPATLIAVGTPGNPITFTSNAVGFNWGGSDAGPDNSNGGLCIGIKSTDSTRFSNCIVEGAYNGFLVDDTMASIAQCRIQKNKNYGVYFGGSRTGSIGFWGNGATFASDTITGNGKYPIRCFASQIPSLPSSLVLSGNDSSGILADGNTIDTSMTWPDLGVPYVIRNSVALHRGTLTIAPGVTCKFKEGASIVVDTGALVASGTAVKPITFGWEKAGLAITKADSAADSVTHWEMFVKDSTSSGTLIDNCNFTNGKVRLRAQSTISNSSFKFYTDCAIKFENAFAQTGAVITNIAYQPGGTRKETPCGP